MLLGSTKELLAILLFKEETAGLYNFYQLLVVLFYLANRKNELYFT